MAFDLSGLKEETDMSATIINLILQLIAGAAGGNILAKLKDFNLGPLGNTISGAVGGGIGGQILQALIPALAGVAGGAGGVDIGSVLGQLAGGGVSGAIVTAIVGVIKNAMVKPKVG